MVYPVWPPALINETWQKKKGKVAKLATKTGVGEAMKAAKSLFDGIDFNQAEASQIKSADRTAESMAQAKEAAVKWHKRVVEPVRDKVKDIRDLAKKAGDSWTKNRLMPKEAAAAAKEVETAADQLWIALKINSETMDRILADYDRKIDEANRSEAAERAKIQDSIKNLTTALSNVSKNLTKAGWTDTPTSPHQRCRSMCNAIKAIPGLKKKFWSEWQPYGDFPAKDVVAGSPTEKAEILALTKKVGASLQTFKAEYMKHM